MATVANIAAKADRLEERIFSLEQNHGGLNEKLIRLDAKMENYNNDLKRMSDTIIEVKNDVKTLIQEPGKKWNSVTMSVILTVVGGILGFIITNILQ
jgi:SMC interacting uncharacterized protein involved in chromosome segregation